MNLERNMSQKQGKDKVVNMTELVSTMTRELDYYWSLGERLGSGTESCQIYRVQQHIREVDRFSYEPFVLSIGPYHHGAARVQALEQMKWGYLDEILRLNCEKALVDYLTAVQELTGKARNYYSDDIKMSSEDFIHMLLLDGCFVLGALGGTQRLIAHTRPAVPASCTPQEIIIEHGNMPERERIQSGDANMGESSTCQQQADADTEHTQCNIQIGQWFFKFINHDLFLLENQIPFFVVRKLYGLVTDKHPTAPPVSVLIDDIVKYVEAALRFYPKAIQESDRPKDFQHLLHLCHMYFRPSHKPEEDHPYLVAPQYLDRFLRFGRRYFKIIYHPDDSEQSSSNNEEADYLHSGQQLNRWRRVAQYMEAGVKFAKRKYDKMDPHSLLGIKFSNHTMEIPCLIIDEHTGFLFRNLIAFEQTCPQFGDDFTAYIVFLSQLISMPEDVTQLAKKEIIVHHLDSDDDVSDLFTILSKDVVFDFNGEYYLKNLCQMMEAHYQSRLNRWMAWLWHYHLSNPWLMLTAVAGVIVLLCTVVQTIFGILAYLKPPT